MSKNASLYCRSLFYFSLSICSTNDAHIHQTFFSRKPRVIYAERPGTYIYVLKSLFQRPQMYVQVL